MFLGACSDTGRHLGCIGGLLLRLRQDYLASMPVGLLVVDVPIDGIDWSTVGLGAARVDGVVHDTRVGTWLCVDLLEGGVLIEGDILGILCRVYGCLENANLWSQVCELLVILCLLLSDLNFQLSCLLRQLVYLLLMFLYGLVFNVHELPQSELILLQFFKLGLVTSLQLLFLLLQRSDWALKILSE